MMCVFRHYATKVNWVGVGVSSKNTKGMSQRVYDDNPCSKTPSRTATTEYGKHLESVTSKLETIAVGEHEELTHVTRSNPVVSNVHRTNPSVVSMGTNGSIQIDFATPSSVVTRRRQERLASIFDDLVISQPETGARPPTPPGSLNWQEKLEPEPLWWYLPSKEDYEEVTLFDVYDKDDHEADMMRDINGLVATKAYLLRNPVLVNVFDRWNWFANDVYLYGTNEEEITNVPYATVYLQRPLEESETLEDSLAKDNVTYTVSTAPTVEQRDFLGMRNVILDYLVSEWYLFLEQTTVENRNRQRFHVLFDTWGYELQTTKFGEMLALGAAGKGSVEYRQDFEELSMAIEARLGDVADWIVSYFLKSSRETSPVWEASAAYQGSFLVDYGQTGTNVVVNSSRVTTATASTANARRTPWTQLPNQVFNAWDDHGVSATHPCPDPATLHEFVFGVVLNRWLPWSLSRAASGFKKLPSEQVDDAESSMFLEWEGEWIRQCEFKADVWNLRPRDIHTAYKNATASRLLRTERNDTEEEEKPSKERRV